MLGKLIMSASNSHAIGSRGRRKATQKPSSRDKAGSRTSTTRSLKVFQEFNGVRGNRQSMRSLPPVVASFGNDGHRQGDTHPGVLESLAQEPVPVKGIPIDRHQVVAVVDSKAQPPRGW